MSVGEPGPSRPVGDSIHPATIETNTNGIVGDPADRRIFTVLIVLFLLATILAGTVGVVGGTLYVIAHNAAIEAEKERALAAEAKRKAMEEREAHAKEDQERERIRRQAEWDRQKAEAEERELQERVESEQRARADQQRMAEMKKEAEERRSERQKQIEQEKLKSEERRLREQQMYATSQKALEFASVLQPLQVTLSRKTARETLFPNFRDSTNQQPGNGLSWRVHALPMLGMNLLYDQFRFDEPWDSSHNLSLLSKIPSAFYVKGDKDGYTRFRTFLRLDGDLGDRTRVSDVTDGLSSTAFIVMVSERQAVPWTRPDSLDDCPEAFPASSLSETSGQRGTILWCDGQHLPYWGSIEDDISAILTPSGGELIVRSQQLEHEMFERNPGPNLLSKNPEELKQLAKEKLGKLSAACRQLCEATSQDAAFSNSIRSSPLSWRVHLLPYLGEGKLYDQLNLNRPWFDPVNLPLAKKMPEVFQFQSTQGRTPFCMRGHSLALEKTLPSIPLVNEMSDASDLTLLMYLAAPQKAAIWTALDDDQPMILNNPQACLGWPESETVLAATAAGEVLELPPNLQAAKWKALLSWRGGEVFDLAEALSNPSLALVPQFRIDPPAPIAGAIPLPAISFPKTISQSPQPTTQGDLGKLRAANFAAMNYFDRYRRSPVHAASTSGKPSQLSWRVHVLPFLGFENLYEKFNFDEAWDSPHNAALLDLMPDCYQTSQAEGSKTAICAFVGPDALFASRNSTNCTDSIASTAVMVHVPTAYAVPWTSPADITVTSELQAQSLAVDGESVQLQMGDASALAFNIQLPNDLFIALLTCQGRELVDAMGVARAGAFLRNAPIVAVENQDRWEGGRMSRIALAMLNYESVFRVLPPGRGKSQEEIPLESLGLSWRVHILPYLGYENLFKQFRLKEAWDSPHNRQLIPYMPDVYRGLHDSTDTYTTRIMGFSGKETLFPEPGRSLKYQEIKDGLSNTILFFQAPDAIQVPWTKPEDFSLDSEPLSQLERLRSRTGIKVGFCDGAILTILPECESETLYSLATPRGGEVTKVSDVTSR
jgi:hypothetical protein